MDTSQVRYRRAMTGTPRNGVLIKCWGNDDTHMWNSEGPSPEYFSLPFTFRKINLIQHIFLILLVDICILFGFVMVLVFKHEP